MKTKSIVYPGLVMASVGIVIALSNVPIIRNYDFSSNNGADKPTPSVNPLTKKVAEEIHPMSIELLRTKDYPSEQFNIESNLPKQANYEQFIASYRSEGLKIYGLLTIPSTPKPEKGFPAVIFVHGYIPPKEYSTTGNYAGYQAKLASAGFITFKPDLRGHGKSEGDPVSAHFSEKYIVDVMHAISSLKKYELADANRIGYWGHSNGGEIGLRIAVISTDVKAFALWAGVVGSYEDMLETYNHKIPFLQNPDTDLIHEYGLPSANKNFWNQIDPYAFLDNIFAPIQLHHGTNDASVPVELSKNLAERLKKENKNVELIEYLNDNHNIGNNANTAWQKTIEFFRTNL